MLLGMILSFAFFVVGAAVGTFIQYKTGWPWSKAIVVPPVSPAKT